MAKQQNNASKTNAQKVRQQNAQSAQGQQNYEFASDTDAQEVRKQNQQSNQRKRQQGPQQ